MSATATLLPPSAAAPPEPQGAARPLHPPDALLSPHEVRASAPTPEHPLSVWDIARGLAGYLALPAVGLLDGGTASVFSAAVAPPIAALFLSVPSLLVGHQFLGLHADPRDLMSDVGRVFVLGGRLALGVVPAVALYAATTRLGPVALIVALTCIGVGSVELARRRLLQREILTKVDDARPSKARRVRMTLLATAWSALSLLIAVRLGITLLTSI